MGDALRVTHILLGELTYLPSDTKIQMGSWIYPVRQEGHIEDYLTFSSKLAIYSWYICSKLIVNGVFL